MHEEQQRLSGQCSRILQRLKEGPVSNAELSTMALKYTSRISDLRAAGYAVEVVSHDRTSGYVTYRLAAGL